ncbi:hypothetical protein KVV02_004968 [Mortierella alpina]|uniref:Protein phosphatase 1 regulatory subunit 7 n=1 Tax=Mortierella alpina TaxID=64518 RepID=A0A9P8A3V8_MORAP|nr:hypothetical protein KVV02_004968 [Mortierella alpina]
MKLTPAVIASQAAGADLQQLKDLNLSKKEINHIEDISTCVNLHKLILSHNSLASADALAGIQYLPSLTLLNLSGNQLDSFEGVQRLKTLFVLNMSHNELNRISIHIEKLVNLKALVLNNNRIKVVDHLGGLTELNTIVLSHNRIQELPSFPLLTKLTKLSAAHNEVRQIPDLSENGLLRELRLNHNKLVTIPDSLRRCTALDILDLGGNMLREWSDVAPLGSLMHLINLNLQGNPICDKPDYKKKILELVPSLRVLDGERFDPRFLEIKAKRAEHKEVMEKMVKKREDLEKKKTLKKIKRGEIQAKDVTEDVMAEADQFERKKKKSKTEKEEKRIRKEEKLKKKEAKAAAAAAAAGTDHVTGEDPAKEKKIKSKKLKDSDSTEKKSSKRSRDEGNGDDSVDDNSARKKSTPSSVFKGNGPRPLSVLENTTDADGDVEMDEEAKAAKAELNRIRKETRKAAKKEAKKEKITERLNKKKAARKELKEPTTLEEDNFFSKPSEEEVKTKKAKIEKAVLAPATATAQKPVAAAAVATTAAVVESRALPRQLDPAEAAKARSGVVAVVDKSAQLAKKNKKPKFDITALEETADAFGGGAGVSGWD